MMKKVMKLTVGSTDLMFVEMCDEEVQYFIDWDSRYGDDNYLVVDDGILLPIESWNEVKDEYECECDRWG